VERRLGDQATGVQQKVDLAIMDLLGTHFLLYLVHMLGILHFDENNK